MDRAPLVANDKTPGREEKLQNDSADLLPRFNAGESSPADTVIIATAISSSRRGSLRNWGYVLHG
jgi:hypothetical protein